jgi:diadenosine tetraphosphate (Ap4A) HIT family hydrolase
MTPDAMFKLDPRLARDTFPIATLALSQVLAMNDARYPWLILVPARSGLSELHELDDADRASLSDEIVTVSRVMERLFAPEKINIGALGNIVRQLHVHVVARRVDDPAWPGPVWGQGEVTPYSVAQLAGLRTRLAAELG